METREQLMKRFGLKEIQKPPSPVRFKKPGELSVFEREEQEEAHKAIDKLVESQGGYAKLYGGAVPERLSSVKSVCSKSR